MNDNDFLEFIGHTPADLEAAQIEIKDLRDILDDYDGLRPNLLDAGESVQRTLGRIDGVHSTRVRIKSSISLARKIIRKHSGERQICLSNYREEIRDLIGLRAFHLFKDGWKSVHDGILDTWELHPQEEQAIAYIRRGDAPALQQSFKEAGCKVEEKDAGYRSVHFVIQTCPQKEPYTAEIQVRTLFEEAWGEIDHQVRYPDHTDDAILNDYLLILNRLAGGADEMASLLLRVKAELTISQSLILEETVKRRKAEDELSRVNGELKTIMSDLQLTQEEKNRLQQQINRIPQIYSQTPEDMMQKIERLFPTANKISKGHTLDELIRRFPKSTPLIEHLMGPAVAPWQTHSGIPLDHSKTQIPRQRQTLPEAKRELQTSKKVDDSSNGQKQPEDKAPSK